MVDTIGGVDYYTVSEFAAIMRVSESTVERWMDEGSLVFWQPKPKSKRRIPSTELNRHLHNHDLA